MGEEAVQFDSEEFRVTISRDRGGNEWIAVGSKVRPRARAPLRSYLLCRFIAFRNGSDPNPRCDLESEARWLVDHEEVILDSAMINSEELRLWNADGARIMFGARPRKKSGPDRAPSRPKLETPGS